MLKTILVLYVTVFAFTSEAAQESKILVDTLLDDSHKVKPSAQEPKDFLENEKSSLDLFLRPPPLRRQPRLMLAKDIDYVINNCSLDDRLITMISYVGKVGITEQQIINLVNANPGKSNPYSGTHHAYLIALACRDGRTNVVSAILKNNPDALNCNNSGLTPLDEAIDFRQDNVEKLLRGKGATVSTQSMKDSYFKSLYPYPYPEENKSSASEKLPEEEDLESTQPYSPIDEQDV